MKFGHMENGRVVLASLPIVIDGCDVFTEDSALMLAAGEKEIIEKDAPASVANGNYTASWQETDTQIIRVWTFVPYTEGELHAGYERLAVSYIRQQYTADDENKILREYLAYGEAGKAAFDAYNTYVEQCKARAYAEVYGE